MNTLIIFNQDEAIVLLEWLHNFNTSEHHNLFNDKAEERVLFDLESKLEEILPFAFQENYKELLNEARERIRDKE